VSIGREDHQRSPVFRYGCDRATVVSVDLPADELGGLVSGRDAGHLSWVGDQDRE